MVMFRRYGQPGFTIVELLIVVVVIAILAAITIVAYTGIQNRAKASALQTSASQAAKKVATYALTNGEVYPLDKPAFLTATSLSESSSLSYLYLASNDGKSYCISAHNPSAPSFSMAVTSSNVQPREGVCTENIARNTRGTSGITGSELAGRYSTTWSWVTGAGDAPTGLSTYGRQTIGTAVTGGGRGTDYNANLDVAAPASVGVWPIANGQTMTASVYVRASVANSNTYISCRTYNAGAWIGSSTQSSSATSTADQWMRLSVSHTSTGDGYLACTTRFGASVTWPIGATMDVTGLLVTSGASLYNFADSASPGWFWDGVVNASSSSGPSLVSS